MSTKRFYVTDRKGNMQDIGAKSVEFAPSHVVFRDDNDEIFLALHSDDVRDLTAEEEG